MKNQVDQLNALGITAFFLNSTLSKTEMTRVRKKTLAGETKLLYVAPESLTKPDNLAFLRKSVLNFVAIDEAHCISEWGHDFRPEYRKIHSIIQDLGALPTIALTATATPKVRQDIQKNLHMETARVFMSSFNRENLYYEVRAKQEAKKQLIGFIQQRKGRSGIIYCLSRKKVEEIAELLQVNDVKALPYHAGMDAAMRIHNQDAFLNEDVDVIVATIAFGMGIDKPDVRFVVHYDAPKSLEGYYQETGRAGRDGQEAHCLMFFSENDIHKLEKFNKDKTVTERDNARHLLGEVTAYATSSICRRRQLLHYFGEHLEKDCGYCDSCSRKRVQFEGKDWLHTALQAIQQTEERFSAEHIVALLTGERTPHIESYQHDRLPLFGAGKGQSSALWMTVLRHGLIYQFLSRDTEHLTTFHLTNKGHEFLEQPFSMTMTEDYHYQELEQNQEEESTPPAPSSQAADEALLDLLLALRKKIAKQRNLPPYVIFQEGSLEEMATVYPTTPEGLQQINGVGKGKAAKFGKPFLALIAQYVEEHDITTVSDVVMKSPANKSKHKIQIIQQIDRKLDLEEIARNQSMSLDELIEEIEHICFAGTKLNLDYYLDNQLDEERLQDIYDYFMEAETDDLAAAMNELGEDDYNEEEVRLVRVKFLSELAM